MTHNLLSFVTVLNLHLMARIPEKAIDGSPLLRFTDVLPLMKSTVKVFAEDGRGTGTFVKFETDRGPLIGLLTNNHVLDQSFFRTSSAVEGEIEHRDQQHVRFPLSTDRYIFTDKFIDTTFVQILDSELSAFRNPEMRLIPCRGFVKKGNPLIIIQHPKGGPLAMAQGQLLGFWGHELRHTVSTEYGSSGGLILNQDYQGVGLHCARSVNGEYNLGVPMVVIQSAINMNYSLRLPRDFSIREQLGALSEAQLVNVRSLGLVPNSQNARVLCRPSTPGIPDLWFYRTNHGLYWTGSNPTKLSDVSAAIWVPVGDERAGRLGDAGQRPLSAEGKQLLNRLARDWITIETRPRDSSATPKAAAAPKPAPAPSPKPVQPATPKAVQAATPKHAPVASPKAVQPAAPKPAQTPQTVIVHPKAWYLNELGGDLAAAEKNAREVVGPTIRFYKMKKDEKCFQMCIFCYTFGGEAVRRLMERELADCPVVLQAAKDVFAGKYESTSDPRSPSAAAAPKPAPKASPAAAPSTARAAQDKEAELKRQLAARDDEIAQMLSLGARSPAAKPKK
jgi:hypothetical protein